MSQLSMEDRNSFALLSDIANKVLPKLHSDIWSWFYCDGYTYQECSNLAGRSVSWVQKSLNLSRPIVLAEALEAACRVAEGELRHGHTLHFGRDTTFGADRTEEEGMKCSYMDIIKRYIFRDN